MNRIFHVVLVEPQQNLNIGSVARVMMNLGFEHLHLVAPENYDGAKATVTARDAVLLLEKIKRYDSLAECLKTMHKVVGFSAKSGKHRPAPVFLKEYVSSLRTEIFEGEEVENIALMFGPEDTGLRMEHIEECTTVVKLPSTEIYPSFNLSHAVALALYELTRETNIPESDRVVYEPLATREQFYQLDRVVEEGLTLSLFFNENTPEHVPPILRNLFRRATPTEREMNILLGVFGSVIRKIRRS